MKDLLTSYSVSEILIFCVMLALAVKGVVSFFDWSKERLKKIFDKGYAEKERDKKINDEISDLEKFYEEKDVVDKGFENINKALLETNNRIDALVQTMNRRIDTLVESDKESIKAYITEKHHYFVYDKGWIDDYNLECLSKRFAVYKEEHGNSFIEGLMDEIYDLPKRPPSEDGIQEKFENTERYVKQAKK
ncbi:MAG: hypothetical protein LUG91_00075 [Ruminococcus sp.]|nr:hypothetical protein [Ruminococcus sp.]